MPLSVMIGPHLVMMVGFCAMPAIVSPAHDATSMTGQVLTGRYTPQRPVYVIQVLGVLTHCERTVQRDIAGAAEALSSR